VVRHVQCILNFSDNLDEDGGTLVVPGFHRMAEKWTQENIQLRKPLPWVTFASDSSGQPLAVEQELLSRAVRVSMREGSVLMWNQIVAHGTRPNYSSRCRTAQFLKAFSRSLAFRDTNIQGSEDLHISHSCGRLYRRSQSLRQQLMKSGAIEIVSPLGQMMFGLDVLPSFCDGDR
jgi:ectoine hydroxylase-related dioxygenase (phytanoyl-CoA dioxygenase family)